MIEPNTISLRKYHGLGNDFLVQLDPSGEARGMVDGEAARRLCDRHRGIGADGLIVANSAPATSGAALVFRLFNADGGEAETSGNGLRCLAHAALDAGMVRAGEPFGVLTPAGRKEIILRGDAVARGRAPVWSSVGMGQAKVRGEAQRCNVGHGQLLVDMGNPHLVVLGPDPAGVDVASLGPALEETDPAGLNVEFVALGPGPDEVTMRVWERGVGETMACGTGSAAAAAALHHWGRVGRRVTVHQPGGAVEVSFSDSGELVLTGPSERVATCQVEL